MGLPGEIAVVSSADREFTDEEIRGFHDLIDEPEQRLWDPGDVRLDLDALFTYFREVLPQRPRQVVFLAKAEDEVVGMCALFAHAEEPEAGVAKIGFGVRSAWTGKGIGRSLVESALAHARASGLNRVIAEVFPHNLRAIRLLTDAGFSIITPEEPPREPAGLAVFEKPLS